MSFLATALVALLSSFGHCYFMCGGFNILVLKFSKELKFSSLAIFLYHLFRILTYTALALVFFYFQVSFFKSDFSKGVLFFALGMFMVLLGLSLLFKLKILTFIENAYVFNKILHKFKDKINFKGYHSFCFLGILNGLLPCGLVYFYIALASSLKSLVDVLLLMFIFGFCTMIVMLLFIKFIKLSSEIFAKIAASLSYILITSYGIYLAFMGLMLSR